uniref:Uncharacterized protein n=1 Tax=Arundo donax TaxID=35708 RepID=A0A0A9C3V0_ARUDO
MVLHLFGFDPLNSANSSNCLFLGQERSFWIQSEFKQNLNQRWWCYI